VPETTLTDEEELFFENLLNAATHFSRTSRDLVEGQLITIETPQDERKPKRILVRFTRDIPAIIGVDMKPYGPFKSEDVATLPLENVENLVKQGFAIKLEVDQ
jgi:DNA replication factor GINS